MEIQRLVKRSYNPRNLELCVFSEAMISTFVVVEVFHINPGPLIPTREKTNKDTDWTVDFIASSRWKSLTHWPNTNETTILSILTHFQYYETTIDTCISYVTLDHIFTHNVKDSSRKTDIHTYLITSTTQMTTFQHFHCRFKALKQAFSGANIWLELLVHISGLNCAMHHGMTHQVKGYVYKQSHAFKFWQMGSRRLNYWQKHIQP